MKRFYYIITWVLLLTTLPACQRHTNYPPAMQQAETLMDTRPDSALCLLQGMADTLAMLPDEAQMYYHLLTIQAKDKQYITHTSDSLINRIVSFYEDSGDKDRLMLAYFYQGSTYRDMNDAPRALKSFHQVIDAGKDTENFTLLGQAYGQMGTLLSKHKLYDEALEVYQKTLSLYQDMGENRRIPLVYRNIARMYNAKEKNDSAIYFYEKGYQMAKENNHERSIYNIASELGCLYYEAGELKKAKPFLLSLTSSSYKVSNALLYLGLIYDAKNNKDSALYFLNQALVDKDMVRKSVAHKTLSKLEQEKGNEAKATYHQKQYQILQDSIQAMIQTENLKEDHQTYNYERLKKDYAILQQENHNYRKGSMVAWILTIIFTCLISCIFFIRRKKRKMLSLKNNTTLSTLCNERIFQLFQKAGRNEIMVSEKDWTELQNLMERKLPDSMNQLSRLSQGFNLSQQEFRICCLLKLGFINQAISNILLVSKSAISRSQSRMYGKLTGEKENASKMRLFIEEL